MAKPSKPKKNPNGEKPGPDGTVYQPRRVRTGTQAIMTTKVRCRPGTFEWRYGRLGNALYHAGSSFARLWEKAGIASAGSSAIGVGGGEGAWRGMPDGRVVALDEVQKISAELGGPIMRRLVSYCVEGRTPREIAATYRQQADERQMGFVLQQDLTDLARAMKFAA
ncbi:hypothetical protein [Aureimonas sp. AU22]|uniref:hypothetical protein n=1 Tax=Aureimonas sp. AU22 TaxID=1638162 RepID=UPI0007812162|nr:hypothetical protein [Aureimonas sp. AU22]